MKPGLWAVVASLLLMTLGVLLYFSASGFLNIFVIPMMQDLSPRQADMGIMAVLVVISFIAALIGGFFSVFLFEMAGGGYRPLMMGVVFALPAIVVQMYVVIAGGMPREMMIIYVLESLMVLLAFVLTAYAGRLVYRRFFAVSGNTTP